MNILSLFDGMSCGRIALERAGIPVTNYFASEIDKYAMQVSKANWPDIEHVGDVTRIGSFLFPEIDILMGGSPCQGFSFAGKQLNFEDPRSKLFFEFVRLKNECQPRYFLLENVVMKKEYQKVISEALGIEPILINSALVSAQNRKRLYWTNIPFTGQPKDKGIFIKHILQKEKIDEKYFLSQQQIEKLITSNHKEGNDIKIIAHRSNFRRNLQIYDTNGKTEALDTAGGGGRYPCVMLKIGNCQPSGRGINGNVYDSYGKCPTLTTNKGEGVKIFDDTIIVEGATVKGFVEVKPGDCVDLTFPSSSSSTRRGRLMQNKSNCLTAQKSEFLQYIGKGIFRRLTPVECERLQTVTDDYTDSVSNTQRYKMLGNGWNIETVVHLLWPLSPYAQL